LRATNAMRSPLFTAKLIPEKRHLLPTFFSRFSTNRYGNTAAINSELCLHHFLQMQKYTFFLIYANFVFFSLHFINKFVYISFFLYFCALIYYTHMYKCKYSRLRVKWSIRRMAQKLKSEHVVDNDTVYLVMLSGGVWFASQLFNALGDIPNEVFYIKGHSYTDNERGQFIWDMMPDIDLKGRQVVVIDDICDSGETLLAIQQLLLAQEVGRLTAVTLLKRCPCQVEQQLTLYSCIADSSKDYFVGCGLDDKGHSRLMRHIAIC